MFTLDAVFLLLLGVFVVLDTAGPEHWWVTGFLLYMPRWIWAVAGALLLLLTAPTARRGSAERRAGRRLTGLLAVALAWSLGPLMGFEVPLRLPASTAPSARRTSLRVLTYNVKSGHHDPHAIAWEIEQAKPDLVQFQDSGKVLLTEVGSVLSAAKGWNLRREGQYVVASRWPLSELTRIDLDVPDPRFFAVRATLTMPDGAPPITVYNVHLLSARYGLLSVRSRNIQVLEQNLEDRLTQADKVAAAIRTGPTGPILLTGDLNAPPSSMAKRSLLSTGLRDAFEASGWGYGFTYGTSTKIGRPYVRIDCILASPDFRADSIYVGNDIGSEHRPVIADLTLTQN
jgi:endonuclease/exonuclease/phosphatase (EEP) superfamily protein YafD